MMTDSHTALMLVLPLPRSAFETGIVLSVVALAWARRGFSSHALSRQMYVRFKTLCVIIRRERRVMASATNA